MAFVLTTAVTVAIYVILAVSFDLVIGYSGQFSVAHAAFYGAGAYGAAIANTTFHVPILAAWSIGVVAAALCSVLISFLAIRIGGTYLVVASIAFQMVIVAIFLNVPALGGSLGVSHIQAPSGLSSSTSFAVAYLVIAALVTTLVWWLANSPFGRSLQTMRESASASMALGKNPTYLKSWSFVIAGALAGLAGAMFASYISYIGSDSFGNSVNILIFAMVIVGGVGTIWGPVLGATLLTVIPAALSLLAIPPNILGPVEQVIYGALLVLIVLFRPAGLYSILGWRRATSKEEEQERAPDEGALAGGLTRPLQALADTTTVRDD